MYREIGGYFELDTYDGNEFYPEAIPLNSGRNAIALLIQKRNYTKIYIPSFCCDAVIDGILKGGASYVFYDINEELMPILPAKLGDSEAILIVNYYGQLDLNMILSYKNVYKRIILDNTQAFFQKPIPKVDTIYSCRKFFGVADGAYLSSDISIKTPLEVDHSSKRMGFVLGRFEESASKYYQESSKNNDIFTIESIKYMSKLTHNLLRALDYQKISQIRKCNATYLHKMLGPINCLVYKIPEGAFMYPFLLPQHIDGNKIRKELQKKKIFVPCLWPSVFEYNSSDSLAYYLAKNIIPLPCDQRYNQDDMQYIIDNLNELI